MSHDYFENRSCEHYPCHDVEHINCLFCFCPFYRTACSGKYTMTNGVKDCSGCTYPHRRENYKAIISRLEEDLDGSKHCD